MRSVAETAAGGGGSGDKIEKGAGAALGRVAIADDGAIEATSGGALRWRLLAGGAIAPQADNAVDVGTATHRPRDIRAARDIYANGVVYCGAAGGAAFTHFFSGGVLQMTAAAGGGPMSVTADRIELTPAGKGIVLKSPNGTRYLITVNDAGALVVGAAP